MKLPSRQARRGAAIQALPLPILSKRPLIYSRIGLILPLKLGSPLFVYGASLAASLLCPYGRSISSGRGTCRDFFLMAVVVIPMVHPDPLRMALRVETLVLRRPLRIRSCSVPRPLARLLALFTFGGGLLTAHSLALPIGLANPRTVVSATFENWTVSTLEK